MTTPREKYLNDPNYNHLVTYLEKLVEDGMLTTVEIIEASVLACISYNMRHPLFDKIKNYNSANG